MSDYQSVVIIGARDGKLILLALLYYVSKLFISYVNVVYCTELARKPQENM